MSKMYFILLVTINIIYETTIATELLEPRYTPKSPYERMYYENPSEMSWRESMTDQNIKIDFIPYSEWRPERPNELVPYVVSKNAFNQLNIRTFIEQTKKQNDNELEIDGRFVYKYLDSKPNSKTYFPDDSVTDILKKAEIIEDEMKANEKISSRSVNELNKLIKAKNISGIKTFIKELRNTCEDLLKNVFQSYQRKNHLNMSLREVLNNQNMKADFKSYLGNSNDLKTLNLWEKANKFVNNVPKSYTDLSDDELTKKSTDVKNIQDGIKANEKISPHSSDESGQLINTESSNESIIYESGQV